MAKDRLSEEAAYRWSKPFAIYTSVRGVEYTRTRTKQNKNHTKHQENQPNEIMGYETDQSILKR